MDIYFDAVIWGSLVADVTDTWSKPKHPVLLSSMSNRRIGLYHFHSCPRELVDKQVSPMHIGYKWGYR